MTRPTRAEAHGSTVYLWTLDEFFPSRLCSAKARDLARQLDKAADLAEAAERKLDPEHRPSNAPKGDTPCRA